MQGNQNVNYSLISAVREGRLEEARQLINSYGLSYSQAWSKGYNLLRDAVKNEHAAVAKLLLTSGSKVNRNSNNPSDTPLHFAVINGDLEIVQMILDKGANINATNQDGKTPLHIAIKKKKMGVTELLLKHRADVNVRDNDGTSLLHVAAEMGCLKIVEHLLEYGAHVNCVCTSTRKKGYTPLHFAVEKGSKEVIMLLLSRGANVQLKGEDGITPLHIAAQKGYTHIAKDLLKHGACSHSSSSYNTPLHYDVENGDIEIVKMILDKGANINATNQDGRTPLHIAIKKKKMGVTELLLKHRADVNVRDNDGTSLLHVAAEMGCLKIVEHLLEYGAHVNCVCTSTRKKGYTPLHFAVEKGSKEVIMLLLSRGANVEVKGEDGITPLHIAVQKGYIFIAKDLLNHGACTHSFTLKEGYTPLHFASKLHNEEVVKLLLNKGADVNASINGNSTPLHIATKARNEIVVKLLLQHGAKVDSQDKDGKTTLCLAVEREYLSIVEDVLKYCPDSNHQSNRSSLRIAVLRTYGPRGKECEKIIQALLEYGLSVNPEDANDSKFLHAAVERGYLKIIEQLCKYGADVNTLYNSSFYKGLTPLHSAVNKNQEEAAKLLISYGADVNAQDETGKTPIFYAIEEANLKITKLLLANRANIKDSPDLLNIAVQKECLEIVEALLQHDADINASDKYGRTALHFTALSDDKNVSDVYMWFPRCIFSTNVYSDINIKGEIADLLLSRGANVDAKTKNGETTLHAAIQKGYAKVVEALLKYNANVNCGVESYITPLLYLSAQKGNAEISKMVLNKGADVNAEQKDGVTALHIATQKCHKEVVKVLLECGAKVDSNMNSDTTPLHLSAQNGNEEISTMLLNKGANVNAKQNDGATALHIATQEGHKEVVEVLLEFGAKVDSKMKSDITPLHLSAESGDEEISKMLLNKGANVNAKQNDGATALHIATENCHEEVVKVLLECGAKVDSKMKRDITPLHLGAKNRYCIEIIETILEFGANIDSRDEDGRTPLHIASQEGRYQVVVTLLKYGSDINITCRDNHTPLDYAMTGITLLFSSSDSLYGKTAEALELHILKMKTANLYVSEKNLSSVRGINGEIRRDFIKYFTKAECEEEIASMKSEKINDPNISFYDILANGPSSLARYMRNENIVQVFKSVIYKTKFPIYASMIECNFRKGMERKELLEQGNKIFHILFSNFLKLPYDCTEEIFSYLSNGDLRILMDACEPLIISHTNINDVVITVTNSLETQPAVCHPRPLAAVKQLRRPARKILKLRENE